MMKQYFEIKEKYQNCILFFRLGDFYEMFYEDAILASKVLEITLTQRDCGNKQKAPMCGVPHHSAENYIKKLVQNGHKVALCEQVESASTNNIVKRDVIRVVTPGTIIDDTNNYILSIVHLKNKYGISICDIASCTWKTTLIEGGVQRVTDEISKYNPVECLINSSLIGSEIDRFLKNQLNCLIELIPEYILDYDLSNVKLIEHFNILSLEGIGLTDSTQIISCASLFYYLQDTQKVALEHLNKISNYNINSTMILDHSTRTNLELTQTLREKTKKGSLLAVLDSTETPMGSRYLKDILLNPLISKNKITKRLDATSELVDNVYLMTELKDALKMIYDIEKMVAKIAYGGCVPKHLLTLKNSIRILPQIKHLLIEVKCTELKKIYNDLDTLEDIYQLIDSSIDEEVGIIKQGYNEEIDKLKAIKEQGSSWLVNIEVREREATGIKNLKIKYNRVFGYFLEVTKSNINLVPDSYIRKQTLSNCERYIIQELKDIEEDILGADEKLIALENEIFTEIKDTIKKHISRILDVSKNISKLDIYTSFADVAIKQDYVKPTLTTDGIIDIKDGRHPVIENILKHSFISNDTALNQTSEQILLITGPNMAGKSTYMRQVALIVLMAQIGSFVPATSASIGIVDRIFTRVGAADDLASGKSTFMVEMMEVANILNNATKNSLLILDEIGRGTSTLDGLSIAQSIIEYITHSIGAKTLFSTHYHELTDIVSEYSNIKNYCVSIKELGEDIIFLHKIIKGRVNKSYGVQVAKLAGLPQDVLNRAYEIIRQQNTIAVKPNNTEAVTSNNTDEKADKLKTTIQNIDVMNITPAIAIDMIYTLQNLANN
ncbi:MAG: DNA mismatch repair protein MutS [Epulopiscium sp. Nuni2H_MBin003]|nr:MAG: DNA mismatch repair protein MutS [Epulopiscium sp. Nuni2H_MBin003]